MDNDILSDIEKEKELKSKFPALEYCDNQEYLEKIKLFLTKRYNANSVDFLIHDSDIHYFINTKLEQVNYQSKINAYVRITKDYGHTQMKDCIRVIVEYSYVHDFKAEKVYEKFDTYQSVDSVYIQSPENGYQEYLSLKKVRDY